MGQTEETYPGLVVVGMITPDFALATLSQDGKGDQENVGARLRPCVEDRLP